MALFHLTTISAATHMKTSEYRQYYERKTTEGKHPVSVLNVVMAKLVSRMFVVVRRYSVYQKNHAFLNNLENIPA